MSGTGPVGVGIIGAGMISEQYLTNLTRFPDVRVLAIGDLDTARAAAAAATWGVPRSGTAEAVLADEDVELVVNLTIPAVHAAVSTAALDAGKHVWTEKPLAVDRASGQALVDRARELGLLLGAAPDTLLGRGWQTARRALAAGVIGTPLTAVTSFQWQGPDVMHPAPEFLFARGGGPLFDMGPYYFSALVQLLGPVASVAATGRTARTTRTVLTGPRTGTPFDVEVPTHLSVLTEFEAGGAAQSLLSFDTPLFRHGVFEVNGTEGTMLLPDPNFFDGPVRVVRPLVELSRPIEQAEEELPSAGPEAGRGLGALDMARALRGGGQHVATGDLGLHVLDALLTVEESVAQRRFLPVESTVAAVPVLPEDFDPFAATL